VLRGLISIFVPGGLLFLMAVLLAGSGLAAHATPAFLERVPLIIWTVGILLAWRFQRSRLVFALLVLALAERALWHGASTPGIASSVIAAAAFLVPLNLMVIFLLRERGIMAGRGGWRLLVFVGQPAAAAGLILFFPAETQKWLHYQMLPLAVPGQSFLPQPALLAFSLVLLFFWFMLLCRRGVLESGFFWATVATVAAFVVQPGPLSIIYLGMAGLILIVAVVEVAYSMAFRDDLTGLPARRALNEALLRLDHTYALAMVDIDFFKKFNDKYGHDVGDQVLCMVAAKLKTISGGGRPFRYGGEEFTILFPGKTQAEVLPHLEKMREMIAGTTFVVRGKNRSRLKPVSGKTVQGSRQKTTVTVSIGLAAANGRTRRPREVLKAADQALYQAKKNGRNQVVSQA
jgi:diguanylate cyclase (GGDEF)-like protein